MIRDILNRLTDRSDGPQTFTALKHRNYRLWFWGQMISLFGSWMQMSAQSFLVFELTKSPAYLGYVGFASGIPTWIFMLYAGVVSDRMSRRDLLIITQTSMMILAFITAGLAFSHVIQPWHIILLAFGFGIANAFDAPARQAMVQELVPFEDMTNAIALNATMFNTAVALGPAIGGLTYKFFGPGWCFMINGLSFIAVIVGLALMKLAPFTPRLHKSSLRTDLKEGLRYVLTHPMIRAIISLVGVVSLFGISFATLIPAWAVRIFHGDATVNGLLLSARALGSLASALLIASLGRFTFRGKLLTTGSFAFPAFLVAFSFVRWLPLSLIVLFGIGFAQVFILNLANASVQTLTPNNLRGRVMSIYTLTFFGMMPLGALFVGRLATHIGEPTTVIVNGLISFTYASIIFLFMPKVRRIQ